MEIGARRLNTNDTSNLITIAKWGRANKIQCSFLIHPRDAGAGVLSSVSMDYVNIEEADALDILGMRISCDALWNDHILRVAKEGFKCLGFLKQKMLHSIRTPYYLQDLYLTSDGVQLSYMGRCFKICFEASRPSTGEGEAAY